MLFKVFVLVISAASAARPPMPLPPARPSGPYCKLGEKAGSCWQAAMSVSSEKIIRERGGYDIKSNGWPKLESGGKRVSFEGRTSMCTSATAAAFLKHISDLTESGKLKLSLKQINFLNGPVVKKALNGNTYSFAALNEAMGGQNVAAKGFDQIKTLLKDAKAGDILKFDRKSRTGHSTVFKEIKGDQFCYWSSQKTRTDGVGERCEPIASLTGVAISRLPGDDLMANGIEKAMQNSKVARVLTATENGSVPADAINWNTKLDCDTAGSRVPQGGQGASEISR